jgi:hypothetical protein
LDWLIHAPLSRPKRKGGSKKVFACRINKRPTSSPISMPKKKANEINGLQKFRPMVSSALTDNHAKRNSKRF